jgi:hypothetical protein
MRAAGIPLVVATLGLTAVASADHITHIQLTGINLSYAGGVVYDSTSINGGGGAPALADPISSATFFSGLAEVGHQHSDVWLDVRLDVAAGFAPSLDPTEPFVQVATGTDDFVDLLLYNLATSAWGVGIDTTSWVLRYNSQTDSIVGSGVGVLCASCTPNPQLPFGLTIGAPIAFSLSAEAFNEQFDAAGNLIAFDTLGTGELRGEIEHPIPEPASLALVGSGLLGLVLRKRARRD